MLKIPGNRSDTIVEFRRGPEGCIQTREVHPGRQEFSVPWRDLSRSEMIFYLDCGGIVGLWLDDLRRQGIIQTRQKHRIRVTTV
ncbi:MAG TPA: hypothetical protein VFJ27_06365 [Terriglobia bacterium]|nr:hypothetical protein [Terriglobia bacterium]